jgi:hypothetical protein
LPVDGQGLDFWNSFRALDLRLIRPRLSRAQLAHIALADRVRVVVARGFAVLTLVRVAVEVDRARVI